MTKKVISIICTLIIIFSMSACSNKNEVIQENVEIEREQYLYSSDILSLFDNNVEVVNPFPDDKLLDRYNNIIYYYSPLIGLYYTDLIGSSKNILTSFESNNYVIFSTQNRIDAISKNGKFFQNVLTRKNDDKIEILFITNDWIYYKTTNQLNEERYFKINLSGTCKELKQNPQFDLTIKDKIGGSYYFPELIDYTTTRDNSYRSKKNNFSIFFPKVWKNNYTIHDEKGMFIVYYRPRVDKSIQYEFFRIVREDLPITQSIVPFQNANDTIVLSNGTYKIGRYQSSFSFDPLSFDGQLITKMIEYIPEIIYSIR